MKELGNWEEKDGLRLSTTPEAFPWWSASWEMKKGESKIEFKFVIRRQVSSSLLSLQVLEGP